MKGNRTVAKGDWREGCEGERHLRLFIILIEKWGKWRIQKVKVLGKAAEKGLLAHRLGIGLDKR